jgi:amino-acid N-acetyltransferase
MNVSIERAVPEDGAAILALLDACALPADGLSNHLGTALVARAQGRIVGSAALEVYADGALLRSVAVEPGLRGNGIGQDLTRAAIAMAHELRLPAVYLLTMTAEGFFPRLGFHRIERAQMPGSLRGSVQFTSACPSSAVAMKRTLGD